MFKGNVVWNDSNIVVVAKRVLNSPSDISLVLFYQEINRTGNGVNNKDLHVKILILAVMWAAV